MKKSLLMISLIAIFSLVFAGAAFAATGITGVVKDIATGAVLSGVTISDGTNSATTNTSGVFTLNESTTGAKTLSATKTGYLKTWQICTVTSNTMTTVNWALTKSYGTQTIPAASMSYVLLAWNDLGMHCDQDDYSYFMVLPPYNTLHVQVIKRPSVVTSGITVSYAFAKKTNSTLHTNWWTYQSQYGFNQPANVGISGTPLAGNMKLDTAGKGFVAEGIPITPYDDDGTWDPYGTATITVKDTTGKVLQTANVVAPVSTEMTCSNCHGTTNPQLDILQKHDARQGTTLAADKAAGKVHACSECHSDNALGAPGKTGVDSLSYAMHNFHTGKSPDTLTGCYNCHPGPITNCNRGIMTRAGKTCVDCHGGMAKLASSQLAANGGRKPWLQEPKCADCHDSKHVENANTLYRNSILTNTAASAMNNKLYCEACHNSTHAEYTTSNAADTSLTMKFQGDNYWFWSCNICHSSRTGAMHR